MLTIPAGQGIGYQTINAGGGNDPYSNDFCLKTDNSSRSTMKQFKFQGVRFGSEKLAPISHERNKSMQTLMTAGKDHFEPIQEKKMDAKTHKKLFGSLSISDVARCLDRSYDNAGFGIKGYEIKSNMRFDFQRNHKVPQ